VPSQSTTRFTAAEGTGGSTIGGTDARERIEREVGSWDGVSAVPHRFGGVEFRLGGRELGHLHGDALADLPFPRRIAAMLVETGRAERHHVLPDSGWVTRHIRDEEDVEAVVELFRLAYERARVAAAVRAERGG
jgi:hypothetical protein